MLHAYITWPQPIVNSGSGRIEKPFHCKLPLLSLNGGWWCCSSLIVQCINWFPQFSFPLDAVMLYASFKWSGLRGPDWWFEENYETLSQTAVGLGRRKGISESRENSHSYCLETFKLSKIKQILCKYSQKTHHVEPRCFLRYHSWWKPLGQDWDGPLSSPSNCQYNISDCAEKLLINPFWEASALGRLICVKLPGSNWPTRCFCRSWGLMLSLSKLNALR